MELYWWAFIITQLIEVTYGYVVLRSHRAVFIILLINCISHPLAWWWYNDYQMTNSLTILFLLEAVIALVEGAVLALCLRSQWQRALLVGILMNGLSFWLGLVVWYSLRIINIGL